MIMWLENSALAEVVRLSLYPWIQILHILSFAVLFGAIVIFDLRIIGYSAKIPVILLANYTLRLARFSLIVVVISGFLLFSAQPTVLIINIAFQLKLLLIAAAGINAFIFHKVPLNFIENSNGNIPRSAKLMAIISLVFWTAIIACGRMIAYV